MMKEYSVRIGILCFFLGVIGSTAAHADCPRRVRDLSIERASKKSPLAYDRRNGTAISRVLSVLRATRSIDPESIYIVLVEDFEGSRIEMSRVRELPSEILTNYVKRHNSNHKRVYRLGKVWVATQKQGDRKIKYYRVTGAPTMLVKILRDLRSIKWAGWEDPQGPKDRPVVTLDEGPKGVRISQSRVTTDLADLLSRRNFDRIREVSEILSQQGDTFSEIFVVVTDQLRTFLTKAARSKGLRDSAFGAFEKAAREAGLKLTKADQARSNQIVGYTYILKGPANTIAEFLQRPSLTHLTWAAFEAPQFEP